MICLAACALGLTAFADEPKPAAAIPIASISHKGAVDFEREVLPILRPNCLVCHNQTSAKAGLNLETPQTMLKGGESGPAIKPKQGSKSLLLQAAAHQTDTPMPPKGNKSAAVDLTPEQLGLIKLWIDQGAKMSTHAARAIEWQALPPGLHPFTPSRSRPMDSSPWVAAPTRFSFIICRPAGSSRASPIPCSSSPASTRRRAWRIATWWHHSRSAPTARDSLPAAIAR